MPHSTKPLMDRLVACTYAIEAEANRGDWTAVTDLINVRENLIQALKSEPNLDIEQARQVVESTERVRRLMEAQKSQIVTELKQINAGDSAVRSYMKNAA